MTEEKAIRDSMDDISKRADRLSKQLSEFDDEVEKKKGNLEYFRDP